MAVMMTINVSGVDVAFRASAAIPRLYRNKYHSDIFKDLDRLSKDVGEGNPDASTLDIEGLETFENIAYLMAWHANPQIPDIDEWLGQFDTLSIYEVLPQLLELWGLNIQREVEAKKNFQQVSGK